MDFPPLPCLSKAKSKLGSSLVWLLLYFRRNESSAIIRPEAGTGLAGTPHNSGESKGNEWDNSQ